MSIDHLLITPSPLGLDENAEAPVGIEPDCLLRTDDADTMVALVHRLEGRPLLWITPSRLITDWNEMTQLLSKSSQPPSRHLVYWTKPHGPSSAPETAGRITRSLARIMDSWTTLFSGGQK